jgi:fibronectin type 3 domain-containing protein
VPRATLYRVKRSSNSAGPFTHVGETTATSFSDTTAPRGHTYFYVVTALNSIGESAHSAVVRTTLVFTGNGSV